MTYKEAPKFYTKDGKIRVKVSDIAILLYNVYLASSLPDFGHLDAEEPLRKYEQYLGRSERVPLHFIEGGLAIAALLNEEGRFVHFSGLSFEEWKNKVLKKLYTQDKNYLFLREMKND